MQRLVNQTCLMIHIKEPKQKNTSKNHTHTHTKKKKQQQTTKKTHKPQNISDG